jgi:glyoxylase I family protein
MPNGSNGSNEMIEARLHHIAMGARDVEQVASFYRQFFGLEERQRHRQKDGSLRSIWLDLGESVLMIEHTERVRDRCDGVDAGAFLLAFTVPEDRIDLLKSRLVAAGYPVEDITEFTTYFRDPEGNRVAISQFPLFDKR